MLTILYSSIDDPVSSCIENECMSLLPDTETEKIKRFVHRRDAILCLRGKLLLMNLLEQSGMSPGLVSNLVYNRFNKPFIAGFVPFSISHSGSMVVCAAATGSGIGIDIEQIKTIDIMDFESQWTFAEAECIRQSDHGLAQFYRMWTRKEAVIKADGRGLSIPLPSIDVSRQCVETAGSSWYLRDIPICNDYVCAVATEVPFTEEIEIKNVHFNDIPCIPIR